MAAQALFLSENWQETTSHSAVPDSNEMATSDWSQHNLGSVVHWQLLLTRYGFSTTADLNLKAARNLYLANPANNVTTESHSELVRDGQSTSESLVSPLCDRSATSLGPGEWGLPSALQREELTPLSEKVWNPMAQGPEISKDVAGKCCWPWLKPWRWKIKGESEKEI